MHAGWKGRLVQSAFFCVHLRPTLEPRRRLRPVQTRWFSVNLRCLAQARSTVMVWRLMRKLCALANTCMTNFSGTSTTV